MKKLTLVTLCLVFFASISFAAQEKETKSSQNFAFGYSQVPVPIDNVNINDVSSLAGRYWFSDDMGVDFTLGFQSGEGNDVFLLGGKLLKKVYNVKNLDIYCLAGIQFGNIAVDNDTSVAAFRIMGGMGAEYYVLPCLSVLTEVGLCFESANTDPSFNQFRVFADWIPQAGIRFYFSKI